MSSAHSDRPRTQPIPLHAFPETGQPASLPLPLTSFVGRERETLAVTDLVCRAGVRLVTLTGPGGVGKTRLAIRVADQVAGRFRDGVWFVPLASVHDVRLVPSVIAEHLDISESGGADIEKEIEAFLASRRSLLVLDNVEHLTEVAPYLADLLANCPGLSILATSREVLRISGEHTFFVPPLDLHDPDASQTVERLAAVDAVQLFAERAAAAEVGFTLTDETTRAVAAICQRLDGLPLAIELAAALVPAFPPAALLERLDRRLALLTGGPRDAPPRLRTMRDAITWSFDLLSPAEQRLFMRLSVFVGGFSLEAAQALAEPNGDRATNVAEGILSLVNKSFLRRDIAETGTRFMMLETIREYGLELLEDNGDEQAVREAHATWCLAFAELAGPELSGPEQHIWVRRLEADLGNIRAALAWLREAGRTEHALLLANAINWFWTMPGRFREGRDLFEELMSLPDTAHSPEALAAVIVTAADLHHWNGAYTRAWELNQQALAMYRALDDRRCITSVLRCMGSVKIDLHEPEEAICLLNESLVHAQATGATWDVAGITNLLGLAAFALGDYETSIARHADAAATWRAYGDTGYVTAALHNLGFVSLVVGDVDRAATSLREALELATLNDDRLGAVFSIEGFGILLVEYGDLPGATQLLGMADTHLTRYGTTRRPAAQSTVDRIVERLRESLGEQAFIAAWETGCALQIDDARAIALAAMPVQSHNGHGLTRREVEVLQLIVAGLTDREIADRLFISRRTASHHAAAILGKLNVPSRRAATDAARRHGLVSQPDNARLPGWPAAKNRHIQHRE